MTDELCPHWNAKYDRCQKGVDCDCAQQCDDDYMGLYKHTVFDEPYKLESNKKTYWPVALPVLAVGLGIWGWILWGWWA